MIKKLFVLIAITLVGFGCTDPNRAAEAVPTATAVPQPTVTIQPTRPAEPTLLAEPATALAYDDAGHWIGVPYWPTTGRDSFTHSVTGTQFSVGGTAVADAFASADAWAHLLDFLESNLAQTGS